MKSALDTAVPAGVVIVMRPEPVCDGTGAVTVVLVAALGVADVVLNVG
jgi:hypothetical protein